MFALRCSLVCAVAVLMAGCGGSGSGTSTSVGSNIFTGNYAGTYSTTQASGSGAATVTVNSDGTVTGTVVDPTSGSGSLSGIVSNLGAASGSLTFPQVGSYSYTGSFVLASKNLTASLDETVNGTVYKVTITATAK